VSGSIEGFLQGAYTGAVETALYGGSLREIGQNAWKGAYTGALFGSIIAPTGQLVGEAGRALRNRFPQFFEKIGLGKTPKAYRYVGPEEARKIEQTGFIPNTKADNVTQKAIYYTDEYFGTGWSAKISLELEKTPEYRIEFDPRSVKADWGGLTSSGSSQFTTREPILAGKVVKLKGH